MLLHFDSEKHFKIIGCRLQSFLDTRGECSDWRKVSSEKDATWSINLCLGCARVGNDDYAASTVQRRGYVRQPLDIAVDLNYLQIIEAFPCLAIEYKPDSSLVKMIYIAILWLY